jgi:hypothetical protein
VKWSVLKEEWLLEEETWVSIEEDIFSLKWKWRIFLGKSSSLYNPCENPRLHGWILHFTQFRQNPKTSFLNMDWSIICIQLPMSVANSHS